MTRLSSIVAPRRPAFQFYNALNADDLPDSLKRLPGYRNIGPGNWTPPGGNSRADHVDVVRAAEWASTTVHPARVHCFNAPEQANHIALYIDAAYGAGVPDYQDQAIRYFSQVLIGLGPLRSPLGLYSPVHVVPPQDADRTSLQIAGLDRLRCLFAPFNRNGFHFAVPSAYARHPKEHADNQNAREWWAKTVEPNITRTRVLCGDLMPALALMSFHHTGSSWLNPDFFRYQVQKLREWGIEKAVLWHGSRFEWSSVPADLRAAVEGAGR